MLTYLNSVKYLKKNCQNQINNYLLKIIKHTHIYQFPYIQTIIIT